MIRVPILLTDWTALLSGDVFHRIVRWVGVDVDRFHNWVEGHCPCGALGEANEHEELLIS